MLRRNPARRRLPRPAGLRWRAASACFFGATSQAGGRAGQWLVVAVPAVASVLISIKPVHLSPLAPNWRAAKGWGETMTCQLAGTTPSNSRFEGGGHRERERLRLTGFWCPEVLGKRGKPAGFAELINSQQIGIPHSPGISISLSLCLSLALHIPSQHGYSCTSVAGAEEGEGIKTTEQLK